MRSVDRAVVNGAMAYFDEMKDTWPSKPARGVQWTQPYAMLAKNIMKLCPKEPVKYTSIASDISKIAVHFGFGSRDDREKGVTIIRAETVQDHRDDLAKGIGRSLAAPLLCWLWLYHKPQAKEIFDACGFDYASEIARFEAEARPATDTVLVAAQNRNKFDLSYLIENAKDRIVLVAQNHWHLISQPEGGTTDFWPKIEAAIRRGVNIEIVAMHPDGPPALEMGETPDAIKLWTLYMKAPAFRSHVELCWEALFRFNSSYQRMLENGLDQQECGSLKLYRAYFVPMTITIVDPLMADGLAVISPRTANEVSGTRPEFVLKRQEHEEPFLYYWSFVENGLANGGWARA